RSDVNDSATKSPPLPRNQLRRIWASGADAFAHLVPPSAIPFPPLSEDYLCHLGDVVHALAPSFASVPMVWTDTVGILIAATRSGPMSNGAANSMNSDDGAQPHAPSI